MKIKAVWIAVCWAVEFLIFVALLPWSLAVVIGLLAYAYFKNEEITHG